MDTFTIKLPNVYIDYCAEASIGDTAGWLEEHGTHYRKCKDEESNIAWAEVVQTLQKAATRKQHHTEIEVSVLQAEVLIDDLRYFECLASTGGFDPDDVPRMRRHGKSCGKARIAIESALDRHLSSVVR
jgi:hypothetical protein